MSARAHVVTFFTLALFAAGPLVVSEGRPEEEPASGAQQEKKPPSVTYGSSRSSGVWIAKPDGSRVAVGDGVEWKGVKVYLSLLWDLVAVDAKTDKTLYAVNVGAFWNKIGFKEVAGADGKKVWAVELSPGPRARAGQDRRQYHDLRTGKQLKVPGLVKAPSGKAFKPRAVRHGKHSRVDKPFHVVVSTADNWKTLRKRMFADAPPKDLGPVDFEKEVVLVISSGNAWNCNGIGVAEAYEDDARILVRTQRHTFQTMGGGQQARPYGIVVLPRRAAKSYVVERNHQGLIGGPALWKESWRLAKLGKPEGELKSVPAATDTRHDGWVK